MSVSSAIAKLFRFLSAALCFVAVSCSGQTGRKETQMLSDSVSEAKIANLTADIRDCIATQDLDMLMPLASELRETGRSLGRKEVYLNGLIYMIQGQYTVSGTVDSALLAEAFGLAAERNDGTAVSKLLNLKGLIALYDKLDYYKGISYLTRGVEYAEAGGDCHSLFALKANLALAAYFWNDPGGLQYAVDMYELGKRHDNEYMFFSGSVIMSYMHNLLGNSETALEYIEPVLGLAGKYREKRGAYSIYGDILSALGRKDEAAEYYKTAITEGSPDERLADIAAYIGYASYLSGEGRHGEALEIMSLGLEQAGETKTRPPKLHLLYRNMASAYEATGNTAEALKYYKLYHEAAGAMFNIEKERAESRWRIEYEKEKHDKQLRLNRKKLQITLLLLITAVTASIGGFILYYRKDINYRRILKQQHEAQEKEKWYRRQLEKYGGGSSEKNGYESAGTSDDKLSELFSRLEKLMYEQKLYRQRDLSRDKVAKILSTNRTYLTEAISRHTGLSFVYYINSFRLQEAAERLSDGGNDIPIKALEDELGFNSHTTFYRLFKAATGLTPSQYRSKTTGRE